MKHYAKIIRALCKSKRAKCAMLKLKDVSENVAVYHRVRLCGGVCVKRICKRCNRILPIEEFWKSSESEDGYHPLCERCALATLPKKKKCRYCERYLPAGEFYKVKASWDGLAFGCKECSNTMSKASGNYKATHQRHAKKRYEQKKQAKGEITKQEREELFDRYGRKCLCCLRPEGTVLLTVDHVVPMSRGGDNTIENAQVLCLACNSFKGDRTLEYRPERLAEKTAM